MHTPPRRPRTALLLAATTATLGLSGCLMPPPLPTAVPQPSAISTPAESTAPVETPSSTPAASGDLPQLVAINTALPPGTSAGWETSVITDAAFEQQADSDFPEGATISVVETATGCSFWAYQGVPDSDSEDEAESSEATLAWLSDSSADDWEPDVFVLSPSASQGIEVEMLSIIAEDGTGTSAWFARNFQSSGSTSSIVADCPAEGGGIDHIDAVVAEHFRISFLQQ